MEIISANFEPGKARILIVWENKYYMVANTTVEMRDGKEIVTDIWPCDSNGTNWVPNALYSEMHTPLNERNFKGQIKRMLTPSEVIDFMDIVEEEQFIATPPQIRITPTAKGNIYTMFFEYHHRVGLVDLVKARSEWNRRQGMDLEWRCELATSGNNVEVQIAKSRVLGYLKDRKEAWELREDRILASL